jgi:uracil-DNA glycosylase family 4
VVAEASGEGEARDGLPLRPYMPSGAIFERTLRRLGLSRDQFVVTNCLRCRPRDNKLEGMPYEQEALNSCSENLAEVLRRFRPKVLLALGGVALRHLTGMAGAQRGVGHLRGYVLRALPQWEAAAGHDRDSDPLLVLPTYHPAFLRRGAIHLTGVFARDIARAVNVAAGRDQAYILDLPDLTYYSNKAWLESSWAEEADREKAAQAKEELDRWLARHNLRYILHPARREIDQFCRDVKARSDAWLALTPDARAASFLCLSHDIETYESASLDEDATDGFTDTQVRLSQFSIEVGQGIALQWDRDGQAATRWLLRLPLPKCGQNYWLFDQKVLKAVGERDFSDQAYFQPAGTVHDTLQQFHFMQPDLPAHLQFAASFAGPTFPFPWKHYNDQCLEFYGIVDTDAALRVYQTTRKTLEDRGIWWDPVAGRQAAGYVAQVEMVRPILAAMEDRGLPIDDQRRLALGVEFDAAEKEARGELDARFPDAARKIQVYKTVPDAVKQLLEEIVPTVMPAADLVNEKGKPLGKGAREKLGREARLARWAGVTTEELATIRQRRFQESPTKNDEGEEEPGEWYFFDRVWVKPSESVKKMIKARAEDMGAQLCWCRVYEFSPNSSPQLMSYMESRRHKIPTSKDGKKTTGKKELIRLSSRFKDDFYLKVIECREIRKAKGTYIDGFRPHADGRVHTTFTFATAIGQLSSRNPNIQNFGKHGRLAKAIRSMVAAEPGMLLSEWDFKSCHVLTLGYLANDPNYIRLARIDMHSIMTGHFLKLWRVQEILKESDAELKERCKWLKSVEKYKDMRDSKIKHAGLGIGNGLKANGLYERYMEFFSGVAEAKAILGAYEEVFPKVFAWQKWVQQRAHDQTFLQTEFGHLRHYYEVFRWDGRKSEWGHGDQGEEAISFWLSNIAFGHIREKLKELERAGLAERYGLCDNIHDSVVFHFEESLLEEQLRLVRPILESPSKVLIGPAAPDGLWIGVDCAVGKNWAEMHET